MTSLKSPRIRFNWGFHDAQFDASRQSARIVVWYGEQTPRQVSYHYDHYYATGYKAGLDQYKAKQARSDTSEPAWQAYRQSLCGSEPAALWEAIYTAEKDELKDCLRIKRLLPRHLDECRTNANLAFWGDSVKPA